MNVTGVPIIWGCDPKWLSAKITNLPKDAIKVRLRFRNKDVATAFVKTPNSVTQYVLQPDGDNLKIGFEQGTNRRL